MISYSDLHKCLIHAYRTNPLILSDLFEMFLDKIQGTGSTTFFIKLDDNDMSMTYIFRIPEGKTDMSFIFGPIINGFVDFMLSYINEISNAHSLNYNNLWSQIYNSDATEIAHNLYNCISILNLTPAGSIDYTLKINLHN